MTCNFRKFIRTALGMRDITEKEATPSAYINKIGNYKNVVIIAGHYKGTGMVTYTGMMENTYCASIVDGLQAKFTNGENVYILKRNTPSYKAYLRQIRRDLKELGIDLHNTLVLELHLNASVDPATGHEQLVIDPRSAKTAKVLAMEFSRRFGIKLRRSKGIYYNPSRGQSFLNECTSLGCSAIIVEQFFATHKTEDSVKFLKNPTKSAEKLAFFWERMIRRIL